jgi:glycosyltransferase involved in cell wall biosynthesis
VRLCIVMGYHASDHLGGAELQMNFLARYAVKRGIDVHYVTRAKDRGQAGTRAEAGVVVHRIPRRLPRDIAAIELLPSALATQSDVYLNRSLDGTFVAWLAARLRGRPFIYSVAHDLDCQSTRFPRAVRPGPWEHYAYDRINRWAVRQATVVVAQTQRQRALLKLGLGIDAPVVYNGHPAPDRQIQKAPVPIVAWIANLKPIKRPELFIDLARDCRDLPCRFLMAGRIDDWSSYRLIQENLASLPNIQYLGPLSFDRANDLLAEASLLINTSVAEGFSNTFIQAWLRETPVISLSVDPDNLINDQELGCRSGSYPGLVDACRRLVCDGHARQSMGARARQYAEKHFTADRFAEEFCEILTVAHS